MKKIDLPLWSDTVCLFLCLLLFFFAVFRFSLPLWAALLIAFAASGAAAALLFLFLRARRKKRHASEGEKAEIGRLVFHLAMSAPETNAALLAKCLNAAAQKNGADGAAAQPPDAPADENADTNAPAAAEGGRAQLPYRAKKDAVLFEKGRALVRFRFEKVTADELSPLVRAKEERKAVFAGAFTDEAKKLADSFGLRLVEAPEVYTLVKESGCMPDPLLAPPKPRGGFLQKLRAGVHRRAWRGYAFAGVSLLLFSLLTIFPVYYIVSGSILLTLALLVRFFGKKD